MRYKQQLINFLVKLTKILKQMNLVDLLLMHLFKAGYSFLMIIFIEVTFSLIDLVVFKEDLFLRL